MNNQIGFIERQVLSWIEVIYHETSKLPSYPVVKSKWPQTFPTADAWLTWLDLPKIKQALSNRGLTRSRTSQASDLSEQQAAAILTVANLTDRRSTPTKLKSLGVTTTQWTAWKKQPAFKKFLYEQLNADFDSSLDRAFTGLLAAVDKGDPRAVQLYLELTDRQPTADEKNYRLAITRIMESLQRHVKNPETLRALQRDFELIGQGQDPILQPVVETNWIAEATND